MIKDKEAFDKALVSVERLSESDAEAILQRLVQKKYEKTLKERVDLSKKKYHGRPSRMQPEVTERLLLALRQGASINMACKFAGISSDLFHIWSRKARTYQDTLRKVEMRRMEAELDVESSFKLTPFEKQILEKANKETMDCVELFILIDQAIAECGVRDLGFITKAASQGSWTAAAFRLGKRFPSDFGEQAQEINVNHNVGYQYVEVNKADRPTLSSEERRQQELKRLNASTDSDKVIDVEATKIN